MTRFLSSLGGKLIVAGVIVALIVFGVSQCRNARNSRSETRLSESQAGAVSDSAADAIGAVGAVSGRNTATDDLTRSNADAIRNAEGADAPVNPAVRDAGLDGLCRRAAYRGKPECLQHASPPGVAGAGAGGTPPPR